MDNHRTPGQARFQGGVFTREQAYAEGWTHREVRRRLEVGHWQVVAGVGLGSADLVVGVWQLAYSVVLSWPGAVVSHETAGVLHGFPITLGDTAKATVAPDRGLVGVRIRAHRVLLSVAEVHWIRDVALTSPRRTAADLLATLSWSEARDLWAWVSTHGVMTRPTLEDQVHYRAGRDGTPQLRRLLRVSAKGSLSAAEDRMLAALKAARLTGWRSNAQVILSGRVVAVVDVLFAEAKVVVQVDGWRTHSGREAFQRDRTQQNVLAAAGYTVLRFTWDDVTQRADSVVRTIRAAIAQAR